MRYKVTDTDAESHRSTISAAAIEKKWDRPVRCSSVLVVVLSVVLVGVCLCAMTFFVMGQMAPRPCLSEQCVTTASRITAAMDRSVEPCQDFYQFACGGWEEKNPVPEWATSWDQLAMLREGLSKDLRILLEEDSKQDLPKSVLKAKALYKTCMDTGQLEADGLEPIQRTFKLVGLPPFPPGSRLDRNETNYLKSIKLDNISVSLNGTRSENGEHSSNATKTSWQTAAGRARRLLGLSALVGLHVAEDVRNTSRNRLVIEQVSPGFSERYLVNPTKFLTEINQYKKYITAMVRRYDPLADAEQFAEDILGFSTGLAQIMTPSEVRRSGSHLFHEVSIIQLIEGANGGPEAWRDMQWGDYLEQVFQDTSIILSPKDDRVIVMDLPYLQKLAVMLTATDKIVIEKFVWWSIFSTVAPLTITAFRDLGFTFSKEVFGLQQRTPRWKGCTANVNANFGIALSYLYVRRHFDQKSREKAIEMLEDVRRAFSGAVQQLDWMDNSTRFKTLNKLKAIRNFVGFPAWLLTQEQLDSNYNNTEIVEGKLFDTYLKLTNTSVKKNLESLRQKPDRNRWVATPTTVNAFYSATLNSVTFPAGILQPPFYGNGIEAINYGSIGAIMGHEVTHGFDDQGRRYDEHGNLKQWWSAATLEHYHGKVQCIIDQYNQYHMSQLPNYTVHGFNTQGENIADNGGLRAALHAYTLFTTRNASVKRIRLPSMEQYTSEQLFFLGFAQIWCGNSTVGALKSKLVEGVHSPNKIRVIGTLSNSKEFAEAWSCPIGSAMNPEHKCILW